MLFPKCATIFLATLLSTGIGGVAGKETGRGARVVVPEMEGDMGGSQKAAAAIFEKLGKEKEGGGVAGTPDGSSGSLRGVVNNPDAPSVKKHKSAIESHFDDDWPRTSQRGLIEGEGKPNGAPCDDRSECASSLCAQAPQGLCWSCSYDLDCDPRGYTDGYTCLKGKCMEGAGMQNGEPCDNHSECASSYCTATDFSEGKVCRMMCLDDSECPVGHDCIFPGGKCTDLSHLTGIGCANLALNRPARQSSTFERNGISYDAGKAVDGNTNGDLQAEGSVSVAAPLAERRSWWEVDLGDVRKVRFVRIYPRTDAAIDQWGHKFSVTVSNPYGGLSLEKSEGREGRPIEIELSGSEGFDTRYIRIMGNHQIEGQLLELAEVEVYGSKCVPLNSNCESSDECQSGNCVAGSIFRWCREPDAV